MRSKTRLGERFGNTAAMVLPIVVVLLSAILAFPLGCGKNDTEEIKIGVVLPLTGEGASLGEDCRNGIELAADDLSDDEKGKIKLYYEDSQGKPAPAVSAFNKLKTSGVRIIIGGLFSSPTLAMAPLADKDGILVFSPGASNPQLSGASKYVFRNYASDNFEGKIIAKYIKDRGYDRIAILYPNNDYGVGLQDVFVRYYGSIGGIAVAVEGYDEDETDFRATLSKVMSADPQSLYLPGYYSTIGRISNQAKELGLDLPMFSNVGVEDPKIFEIAGSSVEGLEYTAPALNLESADEATRAFMDSYKSKYGREPGIPAAQGYDTAKLLFSLIGKCGSQPDAIRKCLLEGRFIGVTGTMEFDENGDVTKQFIIKVIKGGEFEEIGLVEL